MNHFLITRFNLKIFSHDKNLQSVQTDEWTKRRFELFENYCLPSVAAQTNKNFHWLCLFSSETAPEFKQKIAGYKRVVPQFVPMFFDDARMMIFNAELLDTITGLAKDSMPIITTRLDNDDTIHNDFIQLIQRQASIEKSSDVFYTYKFGYQFFEELKVAIKIPYFNNHFLSRVEADKKNLKTVMDIDHFEVAKTGLEIRNISNKPMWIEVIHQSNVDNDIKLSVKIKPVLRQMHFREFGLDVKTRPTMATLSTFSTAFLMRTVKQVERRLVQKFRKNSVIVP